jgi:thioredoxin-related protein
MRCRYLIFILVLAIYFIACRNRNTLTSKLRFPPGMICELKKASGNKYIIYFHSGDCSFCYGILKSITNEITTIPVISITADKNVDLVKYYHEQILFKGISISDSDSVFYKMNQETLDECNMFLIDTCFNIILECHEVDQNMILLLKQSAK